MIEDTASADSAAASGRRVRQVTLVKLGGGLITDKTGIEVCHEERLARLADELRAFRQSLSGSLVLAHGSGSFGHAAAVGTALDPSAATWSGVGTDWLRQLKNAVGRTQDAAARLHRRVVKALLEAELDVYSLAPSSSMSFATRDRLPVVASSAPLRHALGLGMVVVTFGDVLMQEGGGARIASTESVLHALTLELSRHSVSIERCLWLGETAGILDPEGDAIERIDRTNIEQARAWVGGSHGVDVTGGMRLRLETAWAMAEHGVESFILDGRVEGLLSSATPGQRWTGTHVIAERPSQGSPPTPAGGS